MMSSKDCVRRLPRSDVLRQLESQRMMTAASFWRFAFLVLLIVVCVSCSPVKKVVVTKTEYLTVPLDMIRDMPVPAYQPAPDEGTGDDIYQLLEDIRAAIDAHNVHQESVRETIRLYERKASEARAR